VHQQLLRECKELQTGVPLSLLRQYPRHPTKIPNPNRASSSAACKLHINTQHVLAYSKLPSSNEATCAKIKVNATVRKLDTTCYHTAITGANKKLHKSDTNADAVRVRRNDNKTLESSRSFKLKPCLTLPSNSQVCIASLPELVNIPCKGIDYAGTHKLVHENICGRHCNEVLQ